MAGGAISKDSAHLCSRTALVSTCRLRYRRCLGLWQTNSLAVEASVPANVLSELSLAVQATAYLHELLLDGLVYTNFHREKYLLLPFKVVGFYLKQHQRHGYRRTGTGPGFEGTDMEGQGTAHVARCKYSRVRCGVQNAICHDS